MRSWKKSPIQNHGTHRLLIPVPISGEISPGPILFGAQARATIVEREPKTCAPSNTKQICSRVRVCKSIIPKPTP